MIMMEKRKEKLEREVLEQKSIFTSVKQQQHAAIGVTYYY